MSAASSSPALAPVLLEAARIVAAVMAGRTPDAAFAALAEAFRPAVMDMTLRTLRDYGRGGFLLDRLLARPLKTPHAQTTRTLRALLLCALHRLDAQPERAHTTVDQAVDAARSIAGNGPAALTNGVLRNFLRQRDALLGAADADEVARLRHPAWWLAMLRADHPGVWQAIAAAGNTHPPMSLRANHRRITTAEVSSRLAAAGLAHRLLPAGAIRLDTPCPVSQLPGFAQGLVSVQDAGAQRAAALLDVRDGQRVLDACAAPGGKSAHLLESADIDLLALDADQARLARVGDTLARLGLAASLACADARATASWWDGRPFERILADVPCSASGVARRHPDAKWLRREGDVAHFAATQAEILDALWQTLAPGGKMLYATCSVFAAENTQQMAAFVRRHADAVRLPLEVPGDACHATELQLLPTADHDGFFYALLAKRP